MCGCRGRSPARPPSGSGWPTSLLIHRLQALRRHHGRRAVLCALTPRVVGPDHPDTLATRRLARSPSTPRPKPTVYRPLRVTPLTWLFSMDADNFGAYLGSRASALPNPKVVRLGCQPLAVQLAVTMRCPRLTAWSRGSPSDRARSGHDLLIRRVCQAVCRPGACPFDLLGWVSMSRAIMLSFARYCAAKIRPVLLIGW